MEFVKRGVGVCVAAAGVVGLVVAPALAATTSWSYATGQLRAQAMATCPAGMKLMGGGYQASENAHVTASSPDWETESWTVVAVNTKPEAGDISIAAAAVCG